MVVIGQETYTRTTILRQIEAFLAGKLSDDDFRAWIEAYDWDDGLPGIDQHVRNTLGMLELAFHELDDGMSDMPQVGAQVAEIARSLR